MAPLFYMYGTVLRVASRWCGFGFDFSLWWGSGSDFSHFDADPDPSLRFDADPDSTFQFDADPDLSGADPDPLILVGWIREKLTPKIGKSKEIS
jgi:hypothetical protein